MREEDKKEEEEVGPSICVGDMSLLHKVFRCVGNSFSRSTQVTEPTESKSEYLERKGVFITARCHPGETPASFMMRGIMRFLTRWVHRHARTCVCARAQTQATCRLSKRSRHTLQHVLAYGLHSCTYTYLVPRPHLPLCAEPC